MQPLVPQGSPYTADQVRAALHAVHGSRRLSYTFDLLDSNDNIIRDITNLVVAEQSSIKMDNQADDIKRSATFNIKDDGTIDWLRDRIRPWARLQMPDGGFVKWPLGIFLPVAPGRSYQGPSRYREVTAYDKMYILKQSGPNARYVVDEGTNIAGAVVTVLQNLGIDKINIAPCEKTMPTWYDWTPDVAWLDVCNTLLKIINYEPLFVDEQGYFTSRPATTPQQRAEEYVYATDEWSVIATGATDTLDYFSVPNQWVGIVSEPDKVVLTYTYTNDNPSSPTSTVSRGGLIIRKTINVDAADLDSLQGIVEQQAYTDSQVARQVTFSTLAMPIHSYNDVYHLTHAKLGIDGKYQELSWEMPLKGGAEMSHTVQEVISV
ncbi:hypothetical protein [Alicyclobacillus shizuokensis]|uniref:hypothetical protein n=1 Tax=Alicyclobacillus shizuokensis TaxID=392014 RepID=UPI00083559D3|nr:hypothetical protein [Alicyclobacillus shizuokensis]